MTFIIHLFSHFLALTSLFFLFAQTSFYNMLHLYVILGRWVATSLDFDKDYEASVFETTIRLQYKV